MEVKQVFEFVNNATAEAVGTSAILSEDLGNVVEVGTTIFNANAVDKYVKALINHIGKVVVVDRKYTGGFAPELMRDGWEFGSIKEKIRMKTPEATESETWELENLHSYDPNLFYKPIITATFFNKRTTYEVPMSFTELQVKQSFSSASQLAAFVGMIYNEIDKSIAIKNDQLAKRALNNLIAQTLYDESAGSSTTSARAVNLLYEYNQAFGTSLTTANALVTSEFLKFAAYRMSLDADRLKEASTLYNKDGEIRFTPKEYLKVVLLSNFAKAIGPYSLAPAYNQEYLKLPEAVTISFWQGTGTDYDFDDISNIKVTTASGDSADFDGIIGVMFDRDAVAITNENRRVTTNYNPKAEFYSSWFKVDAEYINATDESCIVYYIA